MNLADLVKQTPILSIKGEIDRPIRKLHYDSRKIGPDDVFFAWKGEKTDGHTYIAELSARGVAAVVLEDSRFATVPGPTWIHVANARQALATMSATFFDRPDTTMKMIGITGTNGKTTTSFLLKHLLAGSKNRHQAGDPIGLIGTVRYEAGDQLTPANRTTPESLDLYEILSQMRAARCEAVVMEVSSHALEQGRVSPIDFHVGVFTNLTQDHLDYHGSLDAYFEAKFLLFKNLDRTKTPGVAVLNIDDPRGKELNERLSSRVKRWTYSALGNPAADLATTDLRFSLAGTAGVLRIQDQTAPFFLPLLGTFNVANLLAALGAGRALEIPEETLRTRITTCPQVPGRLEKFTSPDGVTAVVDYAHTDDAVRKVLTALRGVKSDQQRLIAVLGCGGNRDRKKRPLMAQAAVASADLSLFTADNPRNEDVEQILDEMTSGVQGADQVLRWQRLPDRRQAIAHALATAQPGDVVCIAGKGHETTQEMNGHLHPFDDRLVVQEFLKLRNM